MQRATPPASPFALYLSAQSKEKTFFPYNIHLNDTKEEGEYNARSRIIFPLRKKQINTKGGSRNEPPFVFSKICFFIFLST